MVMNKALQKNTIKKKLKNQGTNPDKVDLKGQIDSSISLPENIQNLRDKGILGTENPERPIEVRERISENQIKQAIQRLKQTSSEKELSTDTGITAKKTFVPPLTEEEFQTYINNPDSYDIEGVDTADDFIQVETVY